MNTLLTREDFERQVFARDGNKCVICGDPAKDAHHLIERRIWTEPYEYQGYLVDNGVSVCAEHHMAAEKNWIPPQAFRRILDLPTVKPKSLRCDTDYSKWGDPFRMPTRDAAKYPSSSYLDLSPGKHGGNDVISPTTFADMPVVVTIKMDGSNVALRRDSMGARNGDTANHKSFDMLKALHSGFRHQIPEGIEIFGEWLYAKHSILYTGSLALRSYLQIFAAYDMNWRVWLSWSDVVSLAYKIGYPVVPIVAAGTYKDWQLLNVVPTLGEEVIQDGHEGVVIRSIYPFHYGQFGTFLGKYVRENHVQTDDHWQAGPIVKNEVRA